jgi:adenylate cyclase class IV
MIMIEVEVRSLFSPEMQTEAQEKLAQMRLLREGTSLDVYYDTPDWALLRHPQMVFLRRREGHLLQIKFDTIATPSSLPSCIEREFVLEQEYVSSEAQALLRTFLPNWQQAHTWQEMVRGNHLEALVRIDKQRRVYTDGLLIVCIDEVADLGQFIEVEINCPENADVREAQAQVDAFLATIGGTPLKAGYFEMWLYAYKHEAYELIPERFQVEEHLLPELARKNRATDGRTRKNE